MSERRYLYHTCKYFLLLALILLMVMGGVAAWLLTGPRSITGLSTVVISKLQSSNAPFELKVGSVELGWKEWNRPATIQLEDVVLVSAAYDSELRIPAGEAALDLLPLLWGELRFEHLTLEGVKVGVRRGGGNLYLLNEKEKLFYWFEMKGGGDAKTWQFPFQALSLKDTDISFKDISSGHALQFTGASLKAWREQENTLQFNYQTALAFEEHQSQVEGSGAADLAQENLSVDITSSGFNPSWACGLWFSCETLPHLDMVLEGTTALRLDAKGLQSATFDLRGGEGTLEFKPRLPETLALEGLSVQADVDLIKKTAHLEGLELALKSGTTISAYGDATLEEEGLRLTAEAEATDMPVNDLYLYWPEGLAPKSREWAITRIRGGMAPKATASIRLLPEDSKAEYLPDDFLATFIDVKDSSIDYLPGFPKAQKVNGIVRFTGTTMTADIASATLLKESKVENAKLVFTDLNAAGTPTEATLAITSTPQDINRFMEVAPQHPLKENGISVAQASGVITGEAELAFNAFGDGQGDGKVNWDALTYAVSGKLKDIDGVQVRQSTRLDNLSGSFALSNDAQQMTLGGDTEGGRYQVEYASSAEKPANWAVKGPLTPNLLAGIAPQAKDYIDGTAQLDVSATQSDDGMVVSGSLELTQAALNIVPLGYSKPRGVPATFVFKPAPQDKALKGISATDWTLKADGMDAAGQVHLDNAQQLKLFEISHLQSANQDFALSYWPDEDGLRATVHGKRLDLSAYLEQDSDEPVSISDMGALDVALNLETVALADSGMMRQLQGHLRCDVRFCYSANIGAQYGEAGDFRLRIFNEGGARRFDLQSRNVGKLAAMLGINDRLHGGVADITGTYDDANPQQPLIGRAIVTNFVLKDAPILGRILSAGSLTGLVDSLRGDGIRFSKFASDFTFAEDLLALKDGKAGGSAMGILIDGEVNIGTNLIDVNGNLAPAHMLNSLVGKIPLIGQALVGGEGESVFAINYSVKGDMDDPSVTVNPLSALTPGFTRKFFDVFETPPDTSAPEAPKEETKAPAVTAPPKAPEPVRPVSPDNGTDWQVINP